MWLRDGGIVPPSVSNESPDNPLEFDVTTQNEKARLFYSLHVRGQPLVLFNAWDAGSARAVAEAGAGAVATGSWSVAAANGFADGEQMPFSFALDNLRRGLDAISLSRDVLLDDLDHNWEVLAEAIQTVIRAEVVAGRSTITDPYALLKDLTRGHRVGAAELAEFVEKLEIGDAAKQRLLALTPATYTGIAEQLAR